jgi:hypothetical protein
MVWQCGLFRIWWLVPLHISISVTRYPAHCKYATGTGPVNSFLLSPIISCVFVVPYVISFVLHRYWLRHCWVWSLQERHFSVPVHVTLRACNLKYYGYIQ